MPSVSPEILIWARKTAGHGVADAAKKLGILDSKSASAEQKLRVFELGESEPSRSLLLRMAKQYRRPLLVFYLRKPPIEGSRGEDFRTVDEEIDPAEAGLVNALVRNVKVRQEIVRDAFLSSGERDPLDFVGSFDRKNGAEELVKKITYSLEFEHSAYRAKKNQDEAFKYLRECVEATGVFTMLLGNLGSHHTNLSTKAFRGFALSDDVAPFIVVNDQDAKAAWSVTLIHELAHIWLGESGVSGADFDRGIEKFCNDVASLLLLPEKDLKVSFDFATLESLEGSIGEIDRIAEWSKVSSRLVAYRLLKIDALTKTSFDDISKHFDGRWLENKTSQKAKMKKSSGGPSYYVLKRYRNGSALVEASERMLRSGELSTTKAAAVLGVRPLKLDNMFSTDRRVG